MKSRAVACVLVVGIAATARATPPPPRFFPLDPGNRWTYVEETQGWKAAITVIAIEGSVYRVDLGGRQARIGGLPDALDIELPGDGFVSWYRFQEASFLHRDIFDCNNARLTAVTRSDTVETPAGVFEGCLRLDYPGDTCDDAGRISEWWKPEVGLVQWTEYAEGTRTYSLVSFERLGPRAAFLRGDSDGNLAVDITDAVHTLGSLFQGGPGPACEDAADSNDDGALDISDGIHTLGFLFLGSTAPPFPGPEVAGFDGTPDDPFRCGDSPLPVPEPTGTSSLPGVSFDLAGNPPVITLAQAARGVTFVYRTRIEADLPAVTSRPQDAGGCDRPDASGLSALEMIAGNGQSYCLCDMGRCGRGNAETDLVVGVYEGRFEWDGRNWFGPSDFNNPKGEPFPPGTYTLRVTAAGTRDEAGSEVPWEVQGTVEFHLVP